PVAAAPNKTCSGSWSGDFLNYLTMSRMDALRRVLYGGWRQVDTQDETILQGAFFPQDAHSWGKEYQSIERDGYDIRDYAPLPLPAPDKYHLFAVTTVSDSSAGFPDYTAPLFRVLQNAPYRIWEWVSIEGPVAGRRCTHGVEGPFCVGGGTMNYPGTPGSEAAFDTLEANYAIADYRYGSGNLQVQFGGLGINCTEPAYACNPFNADQDQYLTIIEGQLRLPAGQDGTYQFAVDGDDAVDVEI